MVPVSDKFISVLLRSLTCSAAALGICVRRGGLQLAQAFGFDEDTEMMLDSIYPPVGQVASAPSSGRSSMTAASRRFDLVNRTGLNFKFTRALKRKKTVYLRLCCADARDSAIYASIVRSNS